MLTAEERKYLQIYAAYHERIEIKAKAIFYRALAKSVKPVIETLDINRLDKNVWQAAYEALYKICAATVGRREFKWLKRHEKAVDFFDELFTQRMAMYGRVLGFNFETDLNGTTLEDLRRAFEQGALTHATDSQQARLIYAHTLGKIGRQRALLIARTETTTATNYVKMQAGAEYLKEIGAPVGYKVWLTRMDGKERHDHAAVNEKGVLFTGKFDVGGFECLHPGDPNLPAKERVRCRCTFLTMSAGAYRRRYQRSSD